MRAVRRPHPQKRAIRDFVSCSVIFPRRMRDLAFTALTFGGAETWCKDRSIRPSIGSSIFPMAKKVNLGHSPCSCDYCRKTAATSLFAAYWMPHWCLVNRAALGDDEASEDSQVSHHQPCRDQGKPYCRPTLYSLRCTSDWRDRKTSARARRYLSPPARWARTTC